MDNDNKIVPKQSTTSLFLDNLDIDAGIEKDEYILQDEFKASKKNKDWRIVLILIVMTISLATASWGITRWIEARNIIKDYKLDEFQDVDLMDVLNQVRKVELALEEAERELVLLRREYKKAYQAVVDNTEQEIRILESQDLSRSVVDTRKQKIISQSEIDLKAVDEEYLEKIALQEESITVLREQMSDYDAEKVQQAQEYESVIANEKQKFILEKQQLIDTYEEQLSTQEAEYSAKLEEMTKFLDDLENALRTTSEGQQSRQFTLYNPLVPETMIELRNILGVPVREERMAYNLPKPDSVWAELGYLNSEDFQFLENNVGEWRSLIDYIKDIPFRNDIPQILDQLEYRYLNILDLMSTNQTGLFEKLHETETSLSKTETSLNTTTVSLNETTASLNEIEINLEDKNQENLILNSKIEANAKQIEEMALILSIYKTFHDRFSYSLTLKLRDLGGQGIILDPRQTGDLLAYMDPFLDIPPGTVGVVFGQDNEYVCQISLEQEELFYRVKILHIEEDRELSTFDRVFLRMSSLTEIGGDTP